MILSVIATVYNQKEFVEQMMLSVLTQEVNFDFEFIIADDASTDGSGKVIHDIAERFPNVVFIQNKTNLGAIKNYAQCLSLAQGKYIADIGGDDYWINNKKLQIQVDLLEGDDTIGMVHTLYDTIDSNKRIQPNIYYKNKKYSGLLYEDLLKFNTDICVVTSCFRRCLIQSLIPKFENEIFAYEDIAMWLEISKSHSIAYIDISTACYRINEESLSHSSDTSKALLYIDNVEKIRLAYITKDTECFIPIIRNNSNCERFIVTYMDKESRNYFFSKIEHPGLIIRVLNCLPFKVVLDLHQNYKRIQQQLKLL